jgi:predicted DsbA family dithiol-disulfide isomerase
VAPFRYEQHRVSIVLHGDVLDPWCWIAERRLALAAERFDGRFAPIEHSPFPRRWQPRVPSAAERRARARAVVRAAREKDAPPISPELWISASPPASSAPPLLALAAARLQGAARESALREALREAALVRGLDVSRSDVIVEVASRAPGLDLSRFLSAVRAPATERSVRAAFNAALDRGVQAAPSLVIGEDWLVQGPRTTEEYREILQRFLVRSVGVPLERIVH